MGVLVEALVKKALAKYFALFLKDFQGEDLSLNVLSGQGHISNLTLNEELLQDVLSEAMPNLQVRKAVVTRVSLKVPLTQLKTDPIVVLVEHIDVVLEEPAVLRTFQDILGKSLGSKTKKGKKEKDNKEKAKDKQSRVPKQKSQRGSDLVDLPGSGSAPSPSERKEKAQKYGFKEKIADGITVQIQSITVRIKTLGPVKDESNEQKPPDLLLSIKDLKLYTTDEEWQVKSLQRIRKYNKKKKDIFVFKECQFTMSASLEASGSSIPLVEQLPLTMHLVMKKGRLSGMQAIQVDFQIGDIDLQLNEKSLVLLVYFASGMLSCFSRPDLPAPKVSFNQPKNIKLHPLLIINIALNNTTVRISKENTQSSGYIITVSGFKVSQISPETSPEYEGLMQLSIACIAMTEATTGIPIIGSSTQSQSNSFSLPLQATTIHPLENENTKSRIPDMLTIWRINRYPRPPPPMLAWEMQAHVNNFQLEFWRGYFEDLIIFGYRVYTAVPKTAFASVVIPNFQRARGETIQKGDQAVINLNESFSLKMEVNLCIVLPPPIPEAPTSSLALNLNRLLISSDPKHPKATFSVPVIEIHSPSVSALVKRSGVNSLKELEFFILKNIEVEAVLDSLNFRNAVQIVFQEIVLEMTALCKDEILRICEDHLLWTLSAIGREEIQAVGKLLLDFQAKSEKDTKSKEPKSTLLFGFGAKRAVIAAHYSPEVLPQDAFKLCLENINADVSISGKDESTAIKASLANLLLTPSNDESNGAPIFKLTKTNKAPFVSLDLNLSPVQKKVQASLDGLLVNIDFQAVSRIMHSFTTPKDKTKILSCLDLTKQISGALLPSAPQSKQNQPASLLDTLTLDLTIKEIETLVTLSKEGGVLPLFITEIRAQKIIGEKEDRIVVQSRELASFVLAPNDQKAKRLPLCVPFGFKLETIRKNKGKQHAWHSPAVTAEVSATSFTVSSEHFQLIQMIVKHQVDAFNRIKSFFMGTDTKTLKKEQDVQPSLPVGEGKNWLIIQELRSVDEEIQAALACASKLQGSPSEAKQLKLILEKVAANHENLIKRLQQGGPTL